ncbi:MAG TPA: diguanylate cyclase, partial [Helicobacteraceae bacterium]|nr:diguanylate cyclase [Helicobacteraceae bacterium]
MQNQWSSFKITWILYLVVFLIPVSFYYVSTSFNEIKEGTKVIRQSSWLAGNTFYPLQDKNTDEQHYKKRLVTNALRTIAAWVDSNKNSEFYIGDLSLIDDFKEVQACWKDYPSISMNQVSVNLKCYQETDRLANTIEKMVYLQQNRTINVFYLSLSLAMFLALITIYIVRSYIQYQIKQNAIHDLETNLYNKKYFNAQLQSACARSQRHKDPLTILRVTYHSEVENKKVQLQLLEKIGKVILDATRKSDIAARYDETDFMILMPFTDKDNADRLKQRVRQAFDKAEFPADPNVKFTCT